MSLQRSKEERRTCVPEVLPASSRPICRAASRSTGTGVCASGVRCHDVEWPPRRASMAERVVGNEGRGLRPDEEAARCSEDGGEDVPRQDTKRRAHTCQLLTCLECNKLYVLDAFPGHLNEARVGGTASPLLVCIPYTPGKPISWPNTEDVLKEKLADMSASFYARPPIANVQCADHTCSMHVAVSVDPIDLWYMYTFEANLLTNSSEAQVAVCAPAPNGFVEVYTKIDPSSVWYLKSIRILQKHDVLTKYDLAWVTAEQVPSLKSGYILRFKTPLSVLETFEIIIKNFMGLIVELGKKVQSP